MKNEIIHTARLAGASAAGVCSAEDYGRKAGPSESLEGARSIIVCAFGYYCGDEKGNISRYARGADYHSVLIKRLEPVRALLSRNGYSAKAFADIGELDERRLAQLSGIAFRGKNGMAINEQLGSYFFIGYIVTDCPLEADEENPGQCMGCDACIRACPLGALSGKGFCEEKCLSYITQKKGELSPGEAVAMQRHNAGWGCDICQEVCPHNRGLSVCGIDEFKSNLIFDLDISEAISNKEFKNKYKNRAFSWRGKAVLLRNQRILSQKRPENKKV